MMRRRWNPRFLAARGTRWLVGIFIVLPSGLVAALVAAILWLIWMVWWWMQATALTWRADRLRGRSRVKPIRTITVTAGPRRAILLPSPKRKGATSSASATAGLDVAPRTRGHSVEDVRRSLAGMARHGWPKAKVIETLEAVGAAWMWSQRIDATTAAATAGTVPLTEARERVHLHFRPGGTLFQRYSMPAARIDVWFDTAGRLLHGRAWQNRHS